MPELPEVENIAAGLRKQIQGRTIESICMHTPLVIKGPHKSRWRKSLARFKGAKVKSVTRRGKRLIIMTDNSLALVIQLGMTGTLLLQKPEGQKKRHIHWVINFQGRPSLYYMDVRRFGRVWIIDNPNGVCLDEVMEGAGFSKMGPEPWDISKKDFYKLLANQRMIKTLLLDQTRIAGLGNIYVDESLFAAGVHPARLCCDLSEAQSDKLLRSICSILKRAISYGGTTFSDYLNPYGETGRFLKMLKVYQRTGEPCKKCKTPIERVVLAGRSSHFCAHCQELNT